MSFKSKKGITLIALVITIIVLLILAGVSINAIMGENGIAIKAKQASEKTDISKEVEQINVAYSAAQLDSSTGSYMTDDGIIVTSSQLQTEMNDSYGSGVAEVTGSNSLLIVKYLDSNRSYLIMQNGLVINYDEILENADGDVIGIAEDGTLVDMSLWYYTEVTLGFALNQQVGSWTNPGYNGDIIDGKIEGKVPMYIGTITTSGSYTTEETVEFLPVVSMYYTFSGLDLVEAPEIPDTVTDMYYTFSNCTSLEVAPVIPESVIDVRGTFSNCAALTGTLTINATPTSYGDMLNAVATTSGSLTLTGACDDVVLEEIATTASEGTTITIE